MKRVLIAFAGVVTLVLAAFVVLALNSRVETVPGIDGTTERYYFFGKLRGERTYRNGELNGPTLTYYGDGKVKSEWSYEGGIRQGIARHYTMDGHLRYEDEYVNGERVKRRQFDDRGNLVRSR